MAISGQKRAQMKNWVLVQSGPRKDLKDWFLLVPFGALFEGCLGTEKSTSKKRVLAMRPLTTQDMADASSSVLIELMNCRRRCGKAVCFPDLGAESRRITLNLGWCRRPSRGKKKYQKRSRFCWCPLVLFLEALGAKKRAPPKSRF